MSGDIELTEAAATQNPYVGGAVRADGSGKILLEALGSGAEVVIGSDVSSGSGDVTVRADAEVSFGAGADVSTAGAGTVHVSVSSVSGRIVMDDEASLKSVSGDIYLLASGSSSVVTVGDIEASGANVHIGTTGRILAAADADVEVKALGLSLNAGSGIGLLSGNSLGLPVSALETEVAVLSALSGEATGSTLRSATPLSWGR